MAAAALRQSDELRRDVTQAWFGVVLYGQALNGKLPALQAVISQYVPNPTRAIPSRADRYRESRLKMEWISAHFKIPLKVRSANEVTVG